MEILNKAATFAVIVADPASFKVRPIGKDLTPLFDCLESGSDRFWLMLLNN